MKSSIITATALSALGCSIAAPTTFGSLGTLDRDTLKCGWVVTSEIITPPADSEAEACWRFTPASETIVTLSSDDLTACDLPDDQRFIVVPSETAVTYWATLGRPNDDDVTWMEHFPCAGAPACTAREGYK